MRHRLTFLIAFVGSATLGGAAHAQVHLPCEGATPPRVFAQDLPFRGENLHFHGKDRLLVSSFDGDLALFTPDGSHRIVVDRTRTGGRKLGGIATGPDGEAYLNVGNLEENAEIWRLTNLSQAQAVTEVWAHGLPSANGLAFGPDGAAYVAPLYGPAITRVPPEGGTGEPWAYLQGANGLALDVRRGVIFTPITYDQASSIWAVPLAAPSSPYVVAQLSFGVLTLAPENGTVTPNDPPPDPRSPAVPKGIDDLALGKDGRLYVAAHGSGEVLRVDPVDGSACVLATGLLEPSSVRFARNFGGAEFEGTLFVTEFGGPVVVGLFAPTRGIIRVIQVPESSTAATNRRN